MGGKAGQLNKVRGESHVSKLLCFRKSLCCRYYSRVTSVALFPGGCSSRMAFTCPMKSAAQVGRSCRLCARSRDDNTE